MCTREDCHDCLIHAAYARLFRLALKEGGKRVGMRADSGAGAENIRRVIITVCVCSALDGRGGGRTQFGASLEGDSVLMSDNVEICPVHKRKRLSRLA